MSKHWPFRSGMEDGDAALWRARFQAAARSVAIAERWREQFNAEARSRTLLSTRVRELAAELAAARVLERDALEQRFAAEERARRSKVEASRWKQHIAALTPRAMIGVPSTATHEAEMDQLRRQVHGLRVKLKASKREYSLLRAHVRDIGVEPHQLPAEDEDALLHGAKSDISETPQSVNGVGGMADVQAMLQAEQSAAAELRTQLVRMERQCDAWRHKYLEVAPSTRGTLLGASDSQRPGSTRVQAVEKEMNGWKALAIDQQRLMHRLHRHLQPMLLDGGQDNDGNLAQILGDLEAHLEKGHATQELARMVS